MESNFFLQSSKEHSFEDLNIDEIKIEELRDTFSAFSSNMEEVLFAVQTPFNFAVHSELRIRANNLYNKNKLLARADALRNHYENNASKISEKATELTEDEIKRGALDHGLIDCVISSLSDLEKDDAIKKSNNSTLRQSIVIMWSSVESLLREFLRICLNSNHKYATNFFESEITAKYWNKRQLTFDHLKTCEFDISMKMGDIALEINPCSNIRSITAAFSWVFNPESGFLATINSRDFYYFYKLRNLIAHKNGIIDQQYIKETDGRHIPGQRLEVTPEDFSKYYLLSKKLASSLITDGKVILDKLSNDTF
jgi:hypothetical protein